MAWGPGDAVAAIVGKKRGKHKRAIHKTKSENKEPQLCIFTASDDSNNILFSVSHCGGERTTEYMKYDSCIDRKAMIIADSSIQIKKYIKLTKRNADIMHRASCRLLLKKVASLLQNN
jgi:hypothetical protein